MRARKGVPVKSASAPAVRRASALTFAVTATMALALVLSLSPGRAWGVSSGRAWGVSSGRAWGAPAPAQAHPHRGSAAVPATTGPATEITSTSATLTGTIDPTDPDSAYSFQYGTAASALDEHTPVVAVGAGERQVSASLRRLVPEELYYYRLVLVEGSYAGGAFYGAVRSFQTLPIPSTVATTGAASSVTATTARLNGVTDTTVPGAAWAFDYQARGGRPRQTPIAIVGPGLHAVSALIAGLRPGRAYRFWLFVAQQTPGGPLYDVGSRVTFHTAGARASTRLADARLADARLAVRHGWAQLQIACRGSAGARCDGRLQLTAVRRRRGRSRTIACASVPLALAAGHRTTLRARLRRGCMALLARSRRRTLPAVLRLAFTDRQRPLRRRVTLYAER